MVWLQNNVTGVIAVVLTAGFTTYNVFFNKRSEQKEMANRADDRLIQLLKTTVEALEMKVADLEKKFTEAIVDLARTRQERDTMSAILTGRDERTQEMVKASQVAMGNISVILSLTQSTDKLVRALHAKTFGRETSDHQ